MLEGRLYKCLINKTWKTGEKEEKKGCGGGWGGQIVVLAVFPLYSLVLKEPKLKSDSTPLINIFTKFYMHTQTHKYILLK